ncbi:hypothetical protein KUCAC02_010976 [Chaenocephalus aceratus]|uniref:Uncharacterized protein n=1 Tax=Chaenocephalus aceratus TaxID=36190 RepID=A0ACB9WUC4_CHAAC|nr:hypothetical protein KUCAC02_010976 [Chaenocephalus aceratus]
MTHDDDDDEEDGYNDGFRGDQQDPFDSTLRFGFSVGPDGMRIQEPPCSARSSGRWRRYSPSWAAGTGSRALDTLVFPGSCRHRHLRTELMGGFNDIRKGGPQRTPEEHKEDRDLDSAVSSRGLDQILTPPAGQAPNQPRAHSFFQSVTITKVVKPDGTVEERQTVRDSQGKEETTVTRSVGPGVLEGPEHQQRGPAISGGQNPFGDMRDDDSLFSSFFGAFK